MKVLILSVSAGGGHNSVANAIKSGFEHRGIYVQVLDLYSQIDPILKEIIDKGTYVSASYVPEISTKIYGMMDKKTKPSRKYSISKITNRILAKEIKDKIIKNNWDIIICTHVFAGNVVDILKQKDLISSINVGVITDFTVHPYWQDTTFLDYHIIADETLRNKALIKGISNKQILPFGIPIRDGFNVCLKKSDARTFLKLDPNKKTLLVMAGGDGIGNLVSIIKELDESDKDIQGIVVCGNNKRTYIRLKRMVTKKNFLIFGFYEDISLLMDASDAIITKPGGITTSEAISKRLPIIITEYVGGQEKRNLEFIVNNGLGVYLSDTFDLIDAIDTLFFSKDKINIMKKNISLYAKENSTKSLCEFLIKEALFHD